MTCELCGENVFKTISKRDAKTSERLNVSVCLQCGLVQQDHIPSTESLQNYYSNIYRTEYKNSYTPKQKHVYRAGKTAIERLNFLTLNSIICGKLLDVGAGGGEFVYLSKIKGFDSYGVEPNIGYSLYAKKEYVINIITGQLYDITDSYNVVTMFHVLEHMPTPSKVFKKLWSIIEPGGSLFVEVPNIETDKISPHNIYFKAHIYYFSKATLVAFASPYFEVEAVESSSNLRILFKRRDFESSLILPCSNDVDYTLRRLKQKGWLEYLFKGRGCCRLLINAKKYLTKSYGKHQTGAEILDQLY